MSNKYPNSGALFDANNRVHPSSPDKNGDISIDKSLLQEMMAETPENFVKIKLSGWMRQSARGEFISLKVNTYKPVAAAPAVQASIVDDSDVPF